MSATVEVRDASADGGGAIPVRGQPILYDSWTEIYDPWFGPYQERIAPGAATRAIGEDDIRLLINHDVNLVLARSTNGSLRSSEAIEGVGMEAEMAPTTYARDLSISLARGDVSQMSFSFSVDDESWEMRPDGTWMRSIEALHLYDYSIVTYPAYDATEAALRARSSRAGRRNSTADEEVIRSTADTLRTAADDLEGLVGTNEDRAQPAAPTVATRSALELQQSRHQALFARYGLGGTR